MPNPKKRWYYGGAHCALATAQPKTINLKLVGEEIQKFADAMRKAAEDGPAYVNLTCFYTKPSRQVTVTTLKS